MAEKYHCWKCGVELVDVLQPLPRLAECPHCRAQLHVCRICLYYDPSLGQQCRESVAESVTDKQRANFCGYFQISQNAFYATSDQAAESRRQLNALFGKDSLAAGPDSRSPADVAREQIDQLFKIKGV